MKTYTVTITGQQSHIKGNVYENQTEAQVSEIINKFHDVDYEMPQFDGESYELNNDKYIRIEPTTKTVFILAFDSGSQGTKYIDEDVSKFGTSDEYSAKFSDKGKQVVNQFFIQTINL